MYSLFFFIFSSFHFFVLCFPSKETYFVKCIPLHKAALKGEWKDAEALLEDDPTLIRTPITKGRELALHLAAMGGHLSFVENLLNRMSVDDTEFQNNKGHTALCFAAAAGNIEIAKLMIKKNPDLPKITGDDGITSIHLAAKQGHSELARFLFTSLGDFETWKVGAQSALLTTSIDSGLYGTGRP
ncbi:hypothetical protein CDL12_01581 [Handroanthus impetiginosus]|uniref:Uncharacterized protein n=1 Tax=Handroanthus impetiginosus TaxID=429701 RepID=A0A2G9I7E9_9LAMI|nr:hypothetical protein CDL12_01581 [Handroanthus impetiginosus]